MEKSDVFIVLHTSGREELFHAIVIKSDLTPGAVRPLPGSMYMALFADVAIKKNKENQFSCLPGQSGITRGKLFSVTIPLKLRKSHVCPDRRGSPGRVVESFFRGIATGKGKPHLSE